MAGWSTYTASTFPTFSIRVNMRLLSSARSGQIQRFGQRTPDGHLGYTGVRVHQGLLLNGVSQVRQVSLVQPHPFAPMGQAALWSQCSGVPFFIGFQFIRHQISIYLNIAKRIHVFFGVHYKLTFRIHLPILLFTDCSSSYCINFYCGLRIRLRTATSSICLSQDCTLHCLKCVCVFASQSANSFSFSDYTATVGPL